MGKFLRYFYIHLAIVCSVLAAGSSAYGQIATDTNHVPVVIERPVDTMFKEARIKAFTGHKDTAKIIIDSILKRTPGYNDVKVFLARINTWQQKYDTASIILNQVLNDDPKNQEAIDAFIDLNYWTDHPAVAMGYVDRGLSINNNSDRFNYKKAKIHVYNKQVDSALWVLDTFVRRVPDTAANHQSRIYRDSVLNSAYKRSVDEMFLDARNKAFSGHRDTARLIIDSIFKRSPNYMDVRIFLARINTWDNKYDTAERTLRWVLEKDPANTDAMNAMFDLKYWGGHSQEAESYANMAIKIEPGSDEFHLKKAKALVDQKKLKEAADMLDSFISHHPDSSHASREYREGLRDEMVHNSLTFSYDTDIFTDKNDVTLGKILGPSNNFSAPWHLVSLYYTRQTPIGSIIGRISYANRFNNANGTQYEIDAYPSIAKRTYMYLNVGYSGDFIVFPKYRWGASIYRSLPWAFEAELGMRVLYFAPRLSPVDIFTGSIGKYLGKFWFSLRPFYIPTFDIPGNYVQSSKSLMFITRYYVKGAVDNYWQLSLSKGYSPDDHNKDLILLNNAPNLNSYKIRLGDNMLLGHRTVLNIRASWERLELFYIWRNDFSVGVSLERRF